MRLIPTYACLLLAAWFSTSACADVFDFPVAGNAATGEALQRVANGLKARHNFAGNFVQEKYLSILDKPLRSNGSFAFSADHTFTWQVKEPFAVTYSFAESGLHKQDDNRKIRIKPADDPMLYGFFAFFSSVFDMSQAELEKTFDVYFQQQDQQWLLGLEPKNNLLRDAIATIIVEGEARYGLPRDTLPRDTRTMTIAINKVTIRESTGDYSHLLFSY